MIGIIGICLTVNLRGIAASVSLNERATLFAIGINNKISGIKYTTPKLVPSHIVVHAGGGNNSLESLVQKYAAGLRTFELDFEWTSDGKLVLLHDWDQSIVHLFGKASKQYSIKEFESFSMSKGQTQLTLSTLASWLKSHPGTTIISDIKRNNIEGLKQIKKEYPELSVAIIPQIYRYQEFLQAWQLGYKNIILTLYQTSYKDEFILSFVKDHPVVAVTMPEKRALTSLPCKLFALNVKSYAHTVNDISFRDKLYNNKIYGIYSDKLKK